MVAGVGGFQQPLNFTGQPQPVSSNQVAGNNLIATGPVGQQQYQEFLNPGAATGTNYLTGVPSTGKPAPGPSLALTSLGLLGLALAAIFVIWRR